MKPNRLMLFSLILSIGIFGGAQSTTTSDFEVFPALDLTSEWTEVQANQAMCTTAPWSELILEVQGIEFGNVSERSAIVIKGQQVRIDCYLTTEGGARIELTDLHPIGFGNRMYLTL